MRFLQNILAPLLVICIVPSLSTHADIVQDSSNGSSFWAFSGGIGQSFTADATVVNLDSIAFYFANANESLRPAPNPTMDLFSGSGYGGTLMDSASLTFAEGESDGYRFFDFTGNVLVPGQVYTFRLTQSYNAEGGWSSHSSDVYAGGEQFSLNGTPQSGDLRFQITGSAVPEPSGAMFLGIVSGMALFGRRRRVKV